MYPLAAIFWVPAAVVLTIVASLIYAVAVCGRARDRLRDLGG